MIQFSAKEVRVFSTAFGYFIGEVKEETDDCLTLKDPGQVQVLPNRNPNQTMPTFIITEIIPPFLANKDDLSKGFELRKADILFSGPVVSEFADRYHEYAAKLVKQRSGIQLVAGNLLDKIRKPARKPFPQ